MNNPNQSAASGLVSAYKITRRNVWELRDFASLRFRFVLLDNRFALQSTNIKLHNNTILFAFSSFLRIFFSFLLARLSICNAVFSTHAHKKTNSQRHNTTQQFTHDDPIFTIYSSFREPANPEKMSASEMSLPLSHWQIS